jgi:hydrogenase nickel incorporation protein HypB
MCETCGCSTESHSVITHLATGERVAIEHEANHDHPHDHGHDHHHDQDHDGHHHHHHDHGHGHGHGHDGHGHPPEVSNVIRLQQHVLARNAHLADENRRWLAARQVVALNLMSSPGAGKTTLLERTIRDVGSELRIQVVEGDQETLNDARRIQALGFPVVQINTGTGCHLDAAMVAGGLSRLDPPEGALVMIENVGNLVCPALFDLGESGKVVIASVTEGEDKPMKYPHMFRASELMLLNKIDLLPHVTFDLDKCIHHAREVNPRIQVLRVSATRGDGMAEWYAWLRQHVSLSRRRASAR